MFAMIRSTLLGIGCVALLGSLVQAQQAQQPNTPLTQPGTTKPASGQPATGTTLQTQGSGLDKLTLEDLISRAIKENPDVRVAEAKQKEAEAEVNRARMMAAQKVIAFHSSLVSARHQVADAEEKLKAIRKLSDSKFISQEEVRAAETSLSQKKAELARLEAELPYLVGQSQDVKGTLRPVTGTLFTPNVEMGIYKPSLGTLGWTLAHPTPVDAAVADKIRKALNATVTLKLQDVTLAEALDFFKEKMGVAFLDMLPREVKAQKVSLVFSEPIPTGAALQAIADLTGLRFAVREYGILVAKGDLPSGSMPLHSFWRTAPAAEKK